MSTVAASADAIPVTLLAGFLGSGKTTLLNRLLSDPRMKRAAVVVNEFGSIAVDHDLVHTGSERYVVTTAGCLCCTATSDIRTSLYELDAMRERDAFAPFDRVVIETTGLADPAPIVNSLIPGGAAAFGLRDHIVARKFRLANVVACLDAVEGRQTLEKHIEAWKQLAFADQVVLTKIDMLSAEAAVEARKAWAKTLRSINPTAELVLSDDGYFDPLMLLGSGSYAPSGKADDVVGWLALESAQAHEGHTHDPDRHGDVAALQFVTDRPMDSAALDAFLTILVSQAGSGLLRLKGLVAMADDPDRPLVVHAVQHRLYPSAKLDRWPSEDRRSRLVLIGSRMPHEPLRKLFDAVVSHSDRRLRPRRRLWAGGK